MASNQNVIYPSEHRGVDGILLFTKMRKTEVCFCILLRRLL